MEAKEEINAFLKQVKTYYLATVDNGVPRVRPFGTINLFDGNLYIQTGKKKEVAHQIAKNPHVELCAFSDGTWLRLSATLVEDPRIEAQESMLASYPELSSLYKAGDGNTVVYKLTAVKAVFASFTSAPRTLRF